MSCSNHLTASKEVAVADSENVDRISELPDKLLCHILSFLPTRSAFATCVLAKRWTDVWTETPIIDFTDLPSSITSGPEIVFSQWQIIIFKDFVNRVLLHNTAPCLDRVYFKAYKGFTCTRVYGLMLVLARRCAREICVIVEDLPISPIKLSSAFFLAREKLTVLELEGTFGICLPSSVHLPCLKSLSLVKVVFLDELDPWTSLLSSSNVLEMVNIDSCEGITKFSVCSSSVKTLRIISKNKQREAITIETPNLEVIHLSIGIKRPLVNDLLSLVEARLDVWTSSVGWQMLLERICYTKSLVVYRITLDGSGVLKDMPIFQNLTHLEAGFTSWEIVLGILYNSPNLVSLVIHKLMFYWPSTTIEQKTLFP